MIFMPLHRVASIGVKFGWGRGPDSRLRGAFGTVRGGGWSAAQIFMRNL